MVLSCQPVADLGGSPAPQATAHHEDLPSNHVAGGNAPHHTRRIRVTTMAKKSRKKKARKKSAANHGKRPNS